MKKITILVVAMLIVLSSFSPLYAVEQETVEKEATTSDVSAEKPSEDAVEEEKEVSNAVATTKKNAKSRDDKLREYMAPVSEGGKGLSSINAHVLYYLELVRAYSYPVCFIGLTIGALNFFIIGTKKLEKREQGFSMLVTLIIGLIVFQVLPLLFAIIVAGR